MAKNDTYDMDDDFDMDFGDIDFGIGEPKPPPKNKREALMRSGADVYKGFKSSFTDNKLATVGKMAESAMPSKLKSEFYDVKNSAGNIKGMVEKGFEDLKKEASKTSKMLSKMFPDGKVGGWLKKLNDKLDKDNERQSEAEKQKTQDDAIQQGILSSLGELKEKAHQDAMIQAAIQNRQHATSIEMLRLIYAENKLIRNFNFEVSNRYYRQSLTLQYKNLYIQQEMLELQKLQFTTFRNQFEAMVLNTSLPDILKAKNSERLKETLNQRLRDSAVNTLFKSLSPLGGFTKNLETKIQNSISGLIGGIRGANDAMMQAADMKEMMGSMGMSTSYMLGDTIGGFFKDYLGKKIGDKLFKKSKLIRRGSAIAKDFFADTRSSFRKMSNSKQDGWFGKALRYLGIGGMNLTDVNRINRANYGQNNLDEAMIFDGRAHGALVKVIPGLLSKIYGETKALRIGLKIKGSGKDHEVHFDHKTQSFMTNKGLAHSIKADFKREIDTNTKYAATRLVDTLKTAGINISGKQQEIFARAIVMYLMRPDAVMNSTMIIDDSFVNTIQDPKLQQLLKSRTTRGKYVKAIRDDDWFQEDVINGIQNLRNSIPNMSSRFEELFRSGHGNLLTSLGVAKHDKISGNYYQDDEGLQNFFMNMYDSNSLESLSADEKRRVRERKFGKDDKALQSAQAKYEENKSKYEKFKGNVSKKAAEIKTAISNLDKESLTNYILDTKTKLEDLVDKANKSKIAKDTRAKLKKFQKQARVRYKDLKRRYDKATNLAARTEYMNKMGEISRSVNAFVKEVNEKGVVTMALETKYGKEIDKIAQSAKTQIERATNSADKVITNNLKKADEKFGLDLHNQYETAKTATKNKAKDATEYLKSKSAALKSVDKKTMVTYFSQGSEKVKDFIDTRFPGATTKIKNNLTRAQKRYKEAEKKIKDAVNSKVGKVVDQAQKDELNALKQELKDVTGEYLKTVINEGTNPAMQAQYEERVKTINKQIGNVIKGVGGKAKEQIGRSISGAKDDLYTKGNNLYNGALKAKEEFKEAPIETAKKYGSKILKLFEARPIEELKAEYFESDEYKSGKVSNFMKWIDVMGYTPKGQNVSLLKRVLKKTRAWDRKIFFGINKQIFGAPFRLLGSMFGLRKPGPILKGVGLGASIGTSAATKAMSVALDMLPFGMGTIVKAPFMLMNKTLELVGLKEKEEEKKNRKGSWLSRIKNMFGKSGKKENPKEKKGIMDNLTGLQKAGIGLGAIAIIGALKEMGLGLKDAWNGIKWVGTGILKAMKLISAPFRWLFGAKDDDEENEKNKENQEPDNRSLGEKALDWSLDKLQTGVGILGVGGLAGKFGLLGAKNKGFIKGAWATMKSPYTAYQSGKAGLAAIKAWASAIKSGAGPWQAVKMVKAAGASAQAAEQVVEVVKSGGKAAPKAAGWGAKIVNAMKNFPGLGHMFKSIGNKVTQAANFFAETIGKFKEIGAKVAKKMGPKAAGKAMAKIATFAAKALSVAGLLLCIWDVGWIIYYYCNGRSFWGAVTEQLLGTNLIDDDPTETPEETEIRKSHITEPASSNSGSTYNNTSSSPSRLESGYESFTSTYRAQREQGAGVIRSLTAATIAGGKGFLDKKPLTINRFPQNSPSPYIIPQKQSSDGGKLADILGTKPELQQRLTMFAEAYYDRTGRPLYINSAKRNFDQQVKLWEAESKVKYTGNRNADIEALKKAGGKMFLINGGTVGYPYPGNPHLGGGAVDIQWHPSDNVHDYERHPWVDDALAKFGLKRPYTTFNDPSKISREKNPGKGNAERWHVALDGDRQPLPVEDPTIAKNDPDANKTAQISNYTRREDSDGVYESYNVTANPTLKAINDANKRSLSSSSDRLQAQATAISASSSSSGASAIRPISTTVSSMPTPSIQQFNVNTGSVEDILTKSLQVQMMSAQFLKEIRDALVVQVSTSNNTDMNVMPDMAIDLNRKSYDTMI